MSEKLSNQDEIPKQGERDLGIEDSAHDTRFPSRVPPFATQVSHSSGNYKSWVFFFWNWPKMYNRACCHAATFSKTLAGVFFCCLFMFRNGTKKLKNLGRRFHEWKLVWSFGLIYRVKRVKNSVKNALFKNWLKTHPKNETHEPNVY